MAKRKSSKKKERRKGKGEEVDEEAIQKEDMFMSVDDFEKSRVVVPEYGSREEDEVEDGDDDGGEDDDEDGEEEGEEMVEEDEGEEMGEEEDVPDFCNRECYEFNHRLSSDLDDKCCIHCKKFLTLQCPHIDDFMDDVEGLDPDD